MVPAVRSKGGRDVAGLIAADATGTARTIGVHPPQVVEASIDDATPVARPDWKAQPRQAARRQRRARVARQVVHPQRVGGMRDDHARAVGRDPRLRVGAGGMAQSLHGASACHAHERHQARLGRGVDERSVGGQRDRRRAARQPHDAGREDRRGIAGDPRRRCVKRRRQDCVVAKEHEVAGQRV